jgi:hypothetical protein
MFKRAALLAVLAAGLIAPSALAYESDKDGFAIDFPGKWQTKENFMGTSVISLSPLESARDRFADNVNVVVEDLGQPITLATYTKASLTNLPRFLNQFKVVEKKTVQLGGHEATRLVYEHAQGDYKLRALVYMLVEDTKGYVVTCTAERTSYAKFQPQFEQISQTFRLGEAEAEQ